MPPFDKPREGPAPAPPVSPANPPAPPIAKCPTCQLEIVDATGTPLTTTQTKRVGEKVALTARYKSRCSQCSVRWTIPGTAVKNYEDDATAAKVTQLAPVDKVRMIIAFYWVDGEAGRAVTVRCACGVGVASVTFDVKAPTIDKFDSVTDVVNINAQVTRVQFGNADLGAKQPGIKWNWKVTVPSGVDGWVKDVQLLKSITRLVTESGKKQVWTIPGRKAPPDVFQLDTTNPYSSAGYTKLLPAKVTAGGSYVDDSTFDTPQQPLLSMKSVSLQDQFQYFILYKPDAPDAIWVPVAMASWSWAAEARLAGGSWTLVSKDSSTNPSGGVTTTFPAYSSNVNENKHVDE